MCVCVHRVGLWDTVCLEVVMIGGVQYTTVHRLETNKLRNVAKFFGQLFYADALPWTSMSCIHLNEEETNSSRYGRRKVGKEGGWLGRKGGG